MKSVPLYLNLFHLPAGISPFCGSFPQGVLIDFTHKAFTFTLQAPVFAVVAFNNISIPSTYAVGAGVKVTS